MERDFKVASTANQDEHATKVVKSIVQEIIDQGGNPKDYVISHEIGLLTEDYLNDQYTVRLTATFKANKN